MFDVFVGDTLPSERCLWMAFLSRNMLNPLT